MNTEITGEIPHIDSGQFLSTVRAGDFHGRDRLPRVRLLCHQPEGPTVGRAAPDGIAGQGS